MKKLLTTCVIALLAFSFVLSGCKNKKDDDKPSPSPSEQSSPSPSESKEPKKSKKSSEPKDESGGDSSGGSSGGDDSSGGGSGGGSGSDGGSGGDNTGGGSGGGSGGDEKSAPAMLSKITEKAGEDNELPMSFDSEIKPEASTGIGLKPEQFEEYVEEGRISKAMLTASAHEIALLKCKDRDAALAVKALIAANYDPGKWVSVQPEQCTVVENDVYVLLVASSEAIVDAVIDSAKSDLGDKAGEPNEFFPKSQ